MFQGATPSPTKKNKMLAKHFSLGIEIERLL